MAWACSFTEAAEEDLIRLPRPIQKRVARIMDRMELEPLEGDVRLLSGPEWKGVFRRRMGDYRLLFTVEHSAKKLVVLRILIRSEKTYLK